MVTKEYLKTMDERRHITPRLLTMDEAVVYLKVPKDTLYKMVSQGRIPVVKITNSNRFDQALLDAWIKKNTIMPIINNT